MKKSKLLTLMLATGLIFSACSVNTDEERRVLDKEGNPISGLYAAGEVTGGIHGGNRLGGNAITEIVDSGRTAAKTVSKDNK